MSHKAAHPGFSLFCVTVFLGFAGACSGVVGYGAQGHAPHLNFQQFIFFQFTLSCTKSDSVWPPVSALHTVGQQLLQFSCGNVNRALSSFPGGTIPLQFSAP